MAITQVRIDAPVTGYAASLAVVRALQVRPLDIAPVTIFTGDNGAGKSTLVEAIAVAAGANAGGGSRNARFAAADHSALHRSLTLRRSANFADIFFLRGETFISLTEYHASLARDPLQHLTQRSHGQGIMELARTRFGAGSLIVLDEPEDGLSVLSQLELLGLLTSLSRRGAQIIMATHSPVLLAIPGARIVAVPALEQVPFSATEPVTATREFIRDPAGTAAYLVEPLAQP